MSHIPSVRFVLAAMAVASTFTAFTLNAAAQTQCKARVLIMVDTSGSMSWHFSDNLSPDPDPNTGECEPIKIVDGLPPGIELNCHYRIHPPTYGAVVPGGSLGGAVVNFTAPITLWMGGKPGSPFVDFSRTITIPLICEVHNAPRNPADPVQSFDTIMNAMMGQLPPGDPDFDLLRITAGDAFGLPSPGHTTVRQMPGVGTPAGNYWAVDSFFDITYRIDFVGKPGGRLGGMSGSTTATIRAANTGSPLPLAQMNPLGSADTPAEGIPVVPRPLPGGPNTMHIVNGLPAGSSIEIQTEIIPLSLVSVNPGMLGGPAYTLQCQASWQMTGTGALSAYERTIVWPHILECHVGSIDPTAIVQELDNLTNRLQGQLPPGDPDFDLLRITAGNAFGMPSPGHTTLTRMADGNRWAVDSFFDIAYRIDFVGHPGGPLSGMSGSTTATIRMGQGGELPPYQLDIFGLTHMVTGAAQMDGIVAPDPSDSELVVSNIGSSGEDGVSIQLSRKDPLTTFLFGLHGWSGGVDFGPSGALPPNMNLFFVLADDAFNQLFAALTSLGNGQAVLSAVDDCKGTCSTPYCPYCDPPIDLHVALWNDGVQVAEAIFPPPYPPNLVTGPFGTMTDPTGAAQPVVVSAFAQDADANNGLDRLYMVLSEPQAVPMQLHNNPPVLADMAVLSVNTRPNLVVQGSTHLTIKGSNLPNGELRLSNEGVIHKSTYCVQYRESDFDFVTRLAGSGDVDKNGTPDLVVSEMDSTGNNGVLCSTIPYLEVIEPQGGVVTIAVEALVLDTAQVAVDGTISGGELPSNAAIRYRLYLPSFSTVSALIERCDSGICATNEISAEFTALGATSMRCEVYNNGALVGVSTNLAGPHISTIPDDASLVYLDGSRSQDDGVVITFKWRQVNGPFIFSTADGNLFVGDELRIMPENPDIIPIEISSLSLAGTNISDLAILDSHAVFGPTVPACPADIMPPGGNGQVNVQDLLAAITSWGPCPAPCPPFCAADINHDCTVSVSDLLAVITSWGPCQP